MVTLYNIIGYIFLGLTAYFLWSIDGLLWVKALLSLFLGFVFLDAAMSMNEEKQHSGDKDLRIPVNKTQEESQDGNE